MITRAIKYDTAARNAELIEGVFRPTSNAAPFSDGPRIFSNLSFRTDIREPNDVSSFPPPTLQEEVRETRQIALTAPPGLTATRQR